MQLFSSKSVATDSEIVNFLETIKMPSLNPEARAELDAEITLEEIIG